MYKKFVAYEFREDEKFYPAEYVYDGDEKTGWNIFRQGDVVLNLGKGYRLVKSLYCGICSTDIARAHLPFPLPQITGHEIVALDEGRPVLVEINASHKARGVDDADCPFCSNDLDIHCPSRLTLGIDTLPGGFAPYILAPVNSIIPIPENINPFFASIIEPFAAALHAVTSANIKSKYRVAVLGPRRLGALLLLALSLYRKKSSLDFSITAIIRNSELEPLCLSAGADEIINTVDTENRHFDLVYDTTGSPQGFLDALKICEKVLHVKSTHGLAVGDFSRITEMVINELSLELLTENDFAKFQNIKRSHNLTNLLIDEAVGLQFINGLEQNNSDVKIVKANVLEIAKDLQSDSLKKSPFEQFDAVCVADWQSANWAIRNAENKSLLRPKGVLFWCVQSKNQLSDELSQLLATKQLSIQTSRCGRFDEALEVMQVNPAVFEAFLKLFITHAGEINEINELFDTAKNNKSCIKAVVKHSC